MPTIKTLVNKMALQFGYEIRRPRSERAIIIDDYPVSPTPRWGHGRPSHPHIAPLVEAGRAAYQQNLRQFDDAAGLLGGVPVERASAGTPAWNNDMFTALDAVALMSFLVSRRPRLYLEIGSGNSTTFARHAIRAAKLETRLVSIDPSPRREIDQLCDRSVRVPLERAPASEFAALQPGDILFFDGSHRTFTNSDVTVFFLEILPTLPAGVLVHVHDIFWPEDYPASWGKWYYSEQYLLGAYLLAGTAFGRVEFPSFFAARDRELGVTVRALLDRIGAPHHYPGSPDLPGTSFWFTTGGVR